MQKIELALSLVLPKDANGCSACAARIVAAFLHRPGINQVRVDPTDVANPKLCLYFDPAVIQLALLLKEIEHVGAPLVRHLEHLTLNVTGLRHERDARLVEAAIATEPGVGHAVAAFSTSKVYVEFDPLRTSRGDVLEAIARAGFQVLADSTRARAEEAASIEHALPDPFPITSIWIVLERARRSISLCSSRHWWLLCSAIGPRRLRSFLCLHLVMPSTALRSGRAQGNRRSVGARKGHRAPARQRDRT